MPDVLFTPSRLLTPCKICRCDDAMIWLAESGIAGRTDEFAAGAQDLGASRAAGSSRPSFSPESHAEVTIAVPVLEHRRLEL